MPSYPSCTPRKVVVRSRLVWTTNVWPPIKPCLNFSYLSIQMIIGFGVPWQDLVTEAINSGMVWRIHFSLPGSVDQLKHRTVTKLGRNLGELTEEAGGINGGIAPGNITLGEINKPELRKYVMSSYRWGVYRSLEGLAKR